VRVKDSERRDGDSRAPVDSIAMPVRPRRRAAAAARVTAIALVVALAVAASAYGSQRLLLRTPPQGEQIAAHIVEALGWYRYRTSVVHVRHRPALRAECLEGWQREGRHLVRGGSVIYSDGQRLRHGRHRIVVAHKGRDVIRLRPIFELELAGCGRDIANDIAGALMRARRPRAVPSFFAGHAAYRVRIRVHRAQMEVFADRASLGLLGIRLLTPSWGAWSRIQHVKLTPALKQSFLRRFYGR
jgi:hypothetical protein